jgi:hypothetical protein
MTPRAAPILLAGLMIACRMDAPPAIAGREIELSIDDERSPAPRDGAPECGAMRVVEDADLLRVVGDVAYYARGDTGLSIFDVSAADRPRKLAMDRFTGFPLGVFVQSDTAFVVFVDWNADVSRTVVRALDVRDPSHPRLLGEESVPWTAWDTVRVGEEILVLGGEGSVTVLDSFIVRNGAIVHAGQVSVSGAHGALAAAPGGVVLVHRDPRGASRTTLTWVDTTPTGLLLRGSATVDGAFATWESPSRRPLDVDDGGRAVLVMCGSPGCSSHEPAVLGGVDFADPDRPRTLASSVLAETGGVPTARFVNGVLVYARATSDDASQLVAVRIEESGALRETGRATLRGMVSTIVPRGLDRAVVVGRAARTARAPIAVHDVSVRDDGALGYHGTAVIGQEWAWTPAYDTDRALSIDPTKRFVALPFTSFTEADRAYETGAQVVEMSARGPTLGRGLRAAAFIDRVVFLDGRLLAFGVGGVDVMDVARQGPERPLWPLDGVR